MSLSILKSHQLRRMANLILTAKQKLKYCSEFQTVFTHEDRSHITTLSGSSYSTLADLNFGEEGVMKLLKELDPNKASGPKKIPSWVMQESAAELGPAVTAFFSSDNGSVCALQRLDRSDNIANLQKKVNAHHASNYRPVSLTCVLSKSTEHIICRHILNHLDLHNILSRFQHGFHKSHSCESHLLPTVNDLICSYDQNWYCSADFSRAFHTVAHERLLGKMDHYGITRNVKEWIRSFLCDWQMWVAVDGEVSLLELGGT